MRHAFTLLETIFVIVIFSIITAVGISYTPVNHVRDDAEYISMLIGRTQYEGTGYDHRSFGGGEISSSGTTGCIDLNASGLSSKDSGGGGRYILNSTLSGDLANRRLCFDHTGKPGFDDFSHPFESSRTLILNYGSEERNITIVPLSGFAIIRY